MIKQGKTLLWRALAVLAIVLGLVGVLLPVLPTVPFMLLAAWAASKGWPELEAALLAHRLYGPHITQWRAQGTIARKVKWFACIMMLCSAATLWLVPLPPWLRWGACGVMAGVATWIWRRPEP